MVPASIAPLLMIRNEEFFIHAILSSLHRFSACFVGDTGSTDATVASVQQFEPWARLTQYGECDARKLGGIRGDLAQQAIREGFTWGFQVDGDEIYYPSGIDEILSQDMPARMGMTKLVTIEQQGQDFILLDDVFNRAALFPLTDAWNGEYPFECPESFDLALHDKALFHYFNSYKRPYHGLHVHRLKRSARDGDVYMRLGKQKQHCLADRQVEAKGLLDEWPWEELCR